MTNSCLPHRPRASILVLSVQRWLRLMLVLFAIFFAIRPGIAHAGTLCPSTVVSASDADVIAAHQAVWSDAFGRNWNSSSAAWTTEVISGKAVFEGVTDTGDPFVLRCVFAGEVTGVFSNSGIGWPNTSRSINFIGILTGPSGSVAVGGAQYIDALALPGRQNALAFADLFCPQDAMFWEPPVIVPPWIEDGEDPILLEQPGQEDQPVPVEQPNNCIHNCGANKAIDDSKADSDYQDDINVAKLRFTTAIARAQETRDSALESASEGLQSDLQAVGAGTTLCMGTSLLTCGPALPVCIVACAAADALAKKLAYDAYNGAVSAANSQFLSDTNAAKTAYRIDSNRAKAKRDRAKEYAKQRYQCCVISCRGGECPPVQPPGGGGDS